MNAPTVKCPNCSNRVPIPSDLSEGGEKRVICSNCGVHLRLQRKQSPSWKASGLTTTQLNAIRIPGYRLLGRLGRGGMGSVFSGVQTASNRLVAIKMLLPASASNPDLVLRFEREARMLASLTHPNVVQIIDRGQVGKIYYFVMEYVAGRTLRDRMEEEQLSIRDAVDIITRIGEAIQHCHDHGLVHRDLKPGNVLLTLSGEVKITDFGISGLLRRMGDITDQGVLIGTPQYVAPEQLRDGSRIDHRADQYSLAVLAYEILTNGVPVGVFEPASKKRSDIPTRVDVVLSRALARDPADRYRSVREFIHEFRKAFQYSLTPTPAGGTDTSTQDRATDEVVVSTPDDGPVTPSVLALGSPSLVARADSLEAPLPREPGSAARVPAPPGVSLKTAAPWRPRWWKPKGASTPLVPKAAGRPARSGGEAQDSAPALPEPGSRVRHRNGVPGWWDALEPPHRFAVLGVSCLLLVTLASVGLRYFLSRTSSGRAIVLSGGWIAPSGMAPPVLTLSDLDQAVHHETVSVYLLSTRDRSGEWKVSPTLLQCDDLNGILSRIRLHFLESSLAGEPDRVWRWRAQGGLIATARSSGGPVGLLLVVAPPLDTSCVCRALQDVDRAATRQFPEDVPLRDEMAANLLANSDFSESSKDPRRGGPWNLVPGQTGQSTAMAGSLATLDVRSDPETSARYASLDPDGTVMGIHQRFPLALGTEHAMRVRARSGADPSAWVNLRLHALTPPSSQGPGLAPETGWDSTPSWELSLELDRAWRWYEVRWTPDSSSRATHGHVTLSAEDKPVHIGRVSIQVHSP